VTACIVITEHFNYATSAPTKAELIEHIRALKGVRVCCVTEVPECDYDSWRERTLARFVNKPNKQKPLTDATRTH